MTIKLYYSDQYLKEWDTQILQTIEKGNKYYVVLSETAFYPEGGGQPADRGFIDEIAVEELVENDNTIYHILSQKPLKNTIHCELDFARRFDLMQQHSGQHLLSSVFYDLYNAQTSGFHLGNDYVSIDMAISDITDQMVNEVEKKINEYIYLNLNIKSYIVNNDELKNIPLRKLPKVEEDIRIVEIENIDFSPCCGTHLRRTGEIGVIKITKCEKNKGMTRVYFKCGQRALNDYQTKSEIIQALSSILSTNESEIVSRVDTELTSFKSSQKEIRFLKETMCQYEASEILANNNSRLIIKNFDDKSFSDINILAEQIAKKSEMVFVGASLIEKKILVISSLSNQISLSSTLKDKLQKFNARGGGNDKKVQASFLEIQGILDFEEYLKEIIRI